MLLSMVSSVYCLPAHLGRQAVRLLAQPYEDQLISRVFDKK
jgi:hypothetical protein